MLKEAFSAYWRSLSRLLNGNPVYVSGFDSDLEPEISDI
jgi:hypothetical protein